MPDQIIRSDGEPFAMIFKSVTHSQLSDPAFRLLAFYLNAAPQGSSSRWSDAGIAKALNRSVSSVQRARAELVLSGHLTVRNTGRFTRVTAFRKPRRPPRPTVSDVPENKQLSSPDTSNLTDQIRHPCCTETETRNRLDETQDQLDPWTQARIDRGAVFGPLRQVDHLVILGAVATARAARGHQRAFLRASRALPDGSIRTSNGPPDSSSSGFSTRSQPYHH